MSAPALIGCAAAALLLGLPVAGAAGALDTRLQVVAAADSAALAAADALNGWIEADPCALAAEVARANGHRVETCTLDVERGLAAVSVTGATPFGAMRAEARAGPPNA